jgi:N-acetylmuramic acid 6-phosphate etherase
MQLSNDKLVHRGASYIAQALGVSEETGKTMLKKYGSVHAAIEAARS